MIIIFKDEKKIINTLWKRLNKNDFLFIFHLFTIDVFKPFLIDTQ